MTTITYRDGEIACDTSITNTGGARTGTSFPKIRRNAKGDLAGACGDAAYAFAFLKWFEDGEIKGDMPPAKDADGDLGVIFRARAGQWESYQERGMHTVSGDYYSIGSGSPEARGALFAGASAVGAIKAAIAHDTGTGGEIRSLTHHITE